MTLTWKRVNLNRRPGDHQQWWNRNSRKEVMQSRQNSHRQQGRVAKRRSVINMDGEKKSRRELPDSEDDVDGW